jgi:3-hydroxyisobutyrate dehydrogenase
LLRSVHPITWAVPEPAVGEALALGDALGLERSTLLDILTESPIGGTVRIKRPNIESGNYPANFKLRHALKDLRLVTSVGADRDLRLAAATRSWLEQAAADGAADLDFSAVVATILAAAAAPQDGPNP